MNKKRMRRRIAGIARDAETFWTPHIQKLLSFAEAGTVRIRRLLRRLGKPVSTLRTLPFWIAAVLAGAVSVGYAQLFHLAENLMFSIYSGNPWVLVIASPACFLLGWWIVHRFAPEAAGSGIPQVMAASALYDRKEPARAERLVTLRVGAIKILSSLLCLVGGGAIGREGPTIQISAVIFRAVGSFSGRFIRPIADQAWVIAGSAAGIAAAFNTPLGGIVFTLEELMTAHFNRLRTTVISAVILAGFMAQWLLGPYLYLGFPKVGGTDLLSLPLALLAGATTGIAGGLFSKYLLLLVRRRLALTSFRKKALLTIASSLVVVALAVWVDPRSVGSGTNIMTRLLFESEESGFLLIIARFISTIASYLSGCAGGIFAPALSLGAVIGAELARLAPPEYTNLMILTGMIGFLSSVTRAPFTSFVLVLEMTDRHSVIFPMMIAALSGYTIARTIEPSSFYEQMKQIYTGDAR